jgi:DNA adenine methylase
MRTVLKYPGSKWNIASKLVELIPEHHSYVEPFFGSGAVLFNKPVSDIETINDLDHDVVNLFRCIQEDADRLSRMVMTTPFSREKYEDTYKLDVWEIMMPDEPYHKALRFLLLKNAELTGTSRTKVLEKIRFAEVQRWLTFIRVMM